MRRGGAAWRRRRVVLSSRFIFKTTARHTRGQCNQLTTRFVFCVIIQQAPLMSVRTASRVCVVTHVRALSK